ncbi:hypothetical protein H696_04775 [Fonticula alba]|uniref:GTP-binding protein 8 n=1 Tax=Fonticula alba TaxID=691883 RepID=A0A058Z4S2_FONAL|nr:hypothetical protein H696_04775 [Fonticula alba]KCV68482.1 hypothetical protein H696_04775 [Fonticula alba]|eukprot:XP_009496914.1 hypothetical protein H696_04775 [Fonticula alba]
MLRVHQARRLATWPALARALGSAAATAGDGSRRPSANPAAASAVDRQTHSQLISGLLNTMPAFSEATERAACVLFSQPMPGRLRATRAQNDYTQDVSLAGLRRGAGSTGGRTPQPPPRPSMRPLGQIAFAGSIHNKAEAVAGLPPSVKGLPLVAFAGRSNAGKSTLLNCLASTGGRRTHLVKTAKTPGHTRSLNIFNVADTFGMVDMPGYGHGSRAEWGELVETFLQHSPKISRVYLLVDSRRGLMDSDVYMSYWLNDRAIPFQFILTKMDLVSAGAVERRRREIAQFIVSGELPAADEAEQEAQVDPTAPAADLSWSHDRRAVSNGLPLAFPLVLAVSAKPTKQVMKRKSARAGPGPAAAAAAAAAPAAPATPPAPGAGDEESLLRFFDSTGDPDGMILLRNMIIDSTLGPRPAISPEAWRRYRTQAPAPGGKVPTKK